MTSRRALIDALLGAALGVALLCTAIALAGSWGGTSWLLDLATGTVAGALALRRHRHPAAAAVAGAAVATAAVLIARAAHLPHEPGPATVLALAVLVAAVVRRDGPRAAAVPAGCGLVVVVVAGLCSRPYAEGLDVITVLAALGWLTALAAGLGLRLRDAQQRATLDGVRRDERLDLARELHDLAAHHLTGLVLRTQAARIVARRDATRVDTELAGIETAGADALTAIRRVVGLLRDAASADAASADAAPTLPGPPTPAELIAHFAARPGAPTVRTNLPTGRSAGRRLGAAAVGADLPSDRSAARPGVLAVDADPCPTDRSVGHGPADEVPSPLDAYDESRLPPAVRSTVYRIVQEGLTNVVRHAPHAKTVEVVVRCRGDEVTVTVADDGPGQARGDGGYGLVGMAERVQALGGHVTAGPRPGGGWLVEARVRVAP